MNYNRYWLIGRLNLVYNKGDNCTTLSQIIHYFECSTCYHKRLCNHSPNHWNFLSLLYLPIFNVRIIILVFGHKFKETLIGNFGFDISRYRLNECSLNDGIHNACLCSWHHSYLLLPTINSYHESISCCKLFQNAVSSV